MMAKVFSLAKVALHAMEKLLGAHKKDQTLLPRRKPLRLHPPFEEIETLLRVALPKYLRACFSNACEQRLPKTKHRMTRLTRLLLPPKLHPRLQHLVDLVSH
jgi:hypothetical protein